MTELFTCKITVVTSKTTRSNLITAPRIVLEQQFTNHLVKAFYTDYPTLVKFERMDNQNSITFVNNAWLSAYGNDLFT